MNKDNNFKKNKSENNNDKKEKLNIEYDLELERQDDKYLKGKGYDFVPRSFHWTSADEQKIKVEEIENKTKD